MNSNSYQDAIEAIVKKDPRYRADSYDFVREGLDFTIKELKKSGNEESRHISGQELMDGIRRFALAEFGPMTLQVLTHWGIHATRDVGEIVFNLVEAHVLGKTEDDSPEDFDALFDFQDAFVTAFLPANPEGVASE